MNLEDIIKGIAQKPYFQDESVVIYSADCRLILPQIPDKSIDLVLTSPPYDDLRDYGGYSWDFEHTAEGLIKIISDGGVIVWVVGDSKINGSESGSSFKQVLYFMGKGLNLHDTMIYAKNGFRYPFPNLYHQVFEYMFVLSNGVPKTFNPIMDRLNLHVTKAGYNMKRERDGGKTYRKPFEPSQYGKRYNIWEYDVGGVASYDHPAIFPNELADDHIISWSNPSDLILDPFLGSGTTAFCAKKLGRKCIGIEIEEKYCEIAAKRCSQSVMKLEI